MRLVENTAGRWFKLSVFGELGLNNTGRRAARENQKVFRKPVHPLPAAMAAARRARHRRRRPPPPCIVVQPLPSQCLPQAQNSDPEICSWAQATQGAMWRDRNV